MDTLEVLIAARAEVEKGWCRIQLEDDDGNVCAAGALQRVAANGDYRSALFALRDLLPAWTHGAIGIFNDSKTKADVLALFDRAIAAEAVKVTADPSHVHAVQG
jgi:hypothetical protein